MFLFYTGLQKEVGRVPGAESRERAEKKGTEVLKVEPARGGDLMCCRRSGAGRRHVTAPSQAGSCTVVRVSVNEDGRKDEEQYVGKERMRITFDEPKKGILPGNPRLMHLMEDVHLVENRDSCINAMLDAMLKRGLLAPVRGQEDGVSGEALSGDAGELSEEELRVFAFVKEHGSIKRADAQKLLEVSDRRVK